MFSEKHFQCTIKFLKFLFIGKEFGQGFLPNTNWFSLNFACTNNESWSCSNLNKNTNLCKFRYLLISLEPIMPYTPKGIFYHFAF